MISQITSYGTNPISTVYLNPTQKTNQFTSIAPTAPTRSSDVDTVHLSGSALARSLRLQGYSVEGIAAKLGTNTRIVDQYLGVSGTNGT